MAALMMVFLFIAIAYMLQIKSSQESLADEARQAEAARQEAEKQKTAAEKARRQAEKSRTAAEANAAAAERARETSEESRRAMAEVAEAYFRGKNELDQALHREFGEDLDHWRAEIEDGAIRFREPDILFDTNSAEIKDGFRRILDNFFPRYLRLLTSPRFRDEIEAVRIEGHTSTEWRDARDDRERYLKNAGLSQRRAFSVLDHCFSLPASRERQPWLVEVLRANGLSFARPVRKPDGSVDAERSRRVEFRVITRTAERIRRIIEANSEPAPER